MNLEKDQLEELRTKALEHADKEGQKLKFDLFSQPPPLSVGQSYFDGKPSRRDAEGNVIIAPRNIQTNPMKKGKTQKVFFDDKIYTETEKHPEPYIDPSKLERNARGSKKIIKKKGDDNGDKLPPFLPAVTKWARHKDVKDQHGKKMNRFANPYPHIDGLPRKKKRKIKDEEGKVIIKSRNIQSEPIRHGKYNSTTGHTINKYPEYMDEKQHSIKKKNKAKRDKWNKYYTVDRNGHFKAMYHPKATINTSRQVFGYDDPQPTKPLWATKKKVRRKRGEDEGPKKDPFIPSHPGKVGKQGAFDEFKRLIPNPPKKKVRVRGNEDGPKKDAFKPSRNYLSRPTPSITLNRMNLRSYLR